MQKVFILLLILSPFATASQSETITKWHDKYKEAKTMFFYKSTLNMLNINDSEEFKKLIKDIKKMKLLHIDKTVHPFSTSQYKQLINDYKKEQFEELITFKQKKIKVNAYIKEENGDTKGIALLLNSPETVTILDINGKIPLGKIGEFTQNAGEYFSKSLENFNY